MQKVILVTLDKVNKDFQVQGTYTYVCNDMYSASHLLVLTADRFADDGCKINNIKMKIVNVFNDNI